MVVDVKFRFHIGSIKSSLAMVGLPTGNVSFNSILVRLKVAKMMAEWRITDVFQFHTGSIKR